MVKVVEAVELEVEGAAVSDGHGVPLGVAPGSSGQGGGEESLHESHEGEQMGLQEVRETAEEPG